MVLGGRVFLAGDPTLTVHITMTSKIVEWPVLDYKKQSVAVPGTKKPGQTGRISLFAVTSRIPEN